VISLSGVPDAVERAQHGQAAVFVFGGLRINGPAPDGVIVGECCISVRATLDSHGSWHATGDITLLGGGVHRSEASPNGGAPRTEVAPAASVGGGAHPAGGPSGAPPTAARPSGATAPAPIPASQRAATRHASPLAALASLGRGGPSSAAPMSQTPQARAGQPTAAGADDRRKPSPQARAPFDPEADSDFGDVPF